MEPILRRLIFRLRPAAVLVWALGLLALVAALAVEALAPLVRWDVWDRTQAGQLSIFNAVSEGGFFGLPVEMGDYDGDGKIDLAVAPMAAASGPGGERPKAGEIYLYRGDGAIAGIIDRKAMGHPPGLTIWGARPDDFLGTELYSADVNGDGITDLIAGAQNYDGPQGARANCGGAFVVLGRPGLFGGGGPGGPIIDLAEPPPGVFTVVGRSPGDRLGLWVEAGDLDGDGRSDLLLGADQVAGPGPAGEREHAGAVVVLYGRVDFPPVIDLRDGEAPPSGVSFIHGRDKEDHFGSCIHARDLDRDGRLELVASAGLNRLSASYLGAGLETGHQAGAGDGPNNVREDCGEVFVIFGDAAGGGRLPPLLDLAAPPQGFQERITVIYGQKRYETAGEEITSGDFNGDGFPDLAVGALGATSPDGNLYAGAVHLIYWKPELRGMVIDFQYPERFPDWLVVSDILGLNRSDVLGDTLSAGDFNHDGIDDLVVGVPHLSHGERGQAGAVAVLFGQPEPFPPRVFPNLPEVPLRVSYVYGADSADLFSYSMEAGDYDGDGYADLFPNAMRGDGAEEDSPNAGEVYLLSGFHLSGGRLEVRGVNPQSGRTGEEVLVTLQGDGFTRDEDTRILVGESPAREVRVLSGSRIACRFPPGKERGLVSVTVQNRHGTATLNRAFRYLGKEDFLRGDSTGDLVIDLSDAVLTLSFLFSGGPAECLDRHDSNDDGRVDISDPILTLFWLFGGGPPPETPFPEPGPDPTTDALGCV